MMRNGHSRHEMIEFCKLGLMHSPSGRLLTSETFQGSLNVSGTSLKRRQIWTIFTDAANPTAFFLQNHQGRYLSASRDGKVSVLAEEPGEEERFLIIFDPSGSGEVAFQSEKHLLYLQWTDNGMRCFSKEPVWWGIRLAIHPQVHLLSMHRNHYIRSANKDSELRAVQKAPTSKKYLLWLEQLPMPNMSSRAGQGASLSKATVCRLSRVAIRSQFGRYLRSDGSLTDNVKEATLFSMSFKPSDTPCFLFQDERGDYLSIGSGACLKVKPGGKTARREDFFALKTPSIQVRMWAFNNKFACVRHGLSFSANDDEMRLEKNSIFQLEFVGGKGLTIPDSASANTTSADYPVAFSFDEDDYPIEDDCLPTGLWRLRGQEDKVWQFPRNGPAQMALEKEHGTTFEILFLASCEETSESGRKQLNNHGGIVLRSLDGMAVGAKTLGCISTAENHHITASYRPTEPEVFHLIPFLNRPSIALYSALAFGFLGPSASRHGDELSLDCANAIAEEWFIRRLHSGACRLYSHSSGSWHVLSAQLNGALSLVPASSGPREIDEEEEEEARKTAPNDNTDFVFCLLSEKHVLLRSVLRVGGKSAFLCAGPQGDVKLNASGTITAGCIWQL